MRELARWIDALQERVGRGVSWLMLALVLLVFTDVIFRYLFSRSFVFVQELEWHLFGLVYLLTNTTTGERITVKTMLNEPDLNVPSAYGLWKGADWMEREVYDMYGIVFDGHPDLRRILMPEGFVGYPLRKDYPLRGYGERHNFAPLTRATPSATASACFWVWP